MGNGCVKSFKFSKWIISVLNVFLWLPRDGLISDGKKIQPLPSRCDFFNFFFFAWFPVETVCLQSFFSPPQPLNSLS